tara:strand:+ start:302 stop:1711 length:1410 start_codon:yes stop_codon:yes gene_type:complete
MKTLYIKIKELKITFKVLFILGISSLFLGCEDFVTIDPPQGELISETIFSNETTTLSAITAVYNNMVGPSQPFIYSSANLEKYSGLASDELKNNSINVGVIEIEENNISIENLESFSIWSENYKLIALVNPIIEGLRNNNALPIDFRNQILGEALFFRAFFHFNLVNIFGDIPYANISDVATLNKLSRMPTPEVYQNIIADLLEAKSLMVEDYSHAGGKRVRANKFVAMALLARTYLYTEDWQNAAQEASLIIQNTNYQLGFGVENLFLAGSNSAILQIAQQEGTGGYANTFVIRSIADAEQRYPISDNLLNAFEPGDERFVHWVGKKGIYYFPHKYKKVPYQSSTQNLPSEEFALFRLAEQFLIRAEARAQQGDISGAQTDLNRIRNRAFLRNTSASTTPDILAAIAQEKRIEFFVEGGHRWFDLKRTGKANDVMSPLKSDWQATDVLFPVPVQEILNNSNLSQNPGY